MRPPTYCCGQGDQRCIWRMETSLEVTLLCRTTTELKMSPLFLFICMFVFLLPAVPNWTVRMSKYFLKLAINACHREFILACAFEFVRVPIMEEFPRITHASTAIMQILAASSNNSHATKAKAYIASVRPLLHTWVSKTSNSHAS